MKDLLASTIRTLLIIAAIIIAVWIIVDAIKGRTKDMVEYWENKDFKTDTVYVDIDYTKIPKPSYDIQIPPAKVIEYPQTVVNNTYIVKNDSLLAVIDSLKKEATIIHETYLKLDPGKSKLIYALFTADSINLDLLKIDGQMQSLVYKTNYNRFDYIFDGYNMGVNEHTPPALRGTYPNLSIDLMGGYKFISPDFTYKFSNRLGITAQPIFFTDKQSLFLGGIKYKVR